MVDSRGWRKVVGSVGWMAALLVHLKAALKATLMVVKRVVPMVGKMAVRKEERRGARKVVLKAA